MFESPSVGTTASPQRSRSIRIIVVALVILSVLGYAGGALLLPAMIRSAYQENKCEQVLSHAERYARLYPVGFMPNELAEPVRECAVYTLGLTREQDGAWRDSHAAFRVYIDSYPQGSFVEEAREHAGAVLVGLAKQQLSEQDYAAALENIDRVLRDYGDTDAIKEAESLTPDVYLAWGTDLRDSGHFAESEQIFLAAASDDGSPSPQLAQTYLEWGQALQAEEKFLEATSKFDLAESLDTASPANVSPVDQIKFYTDWGNSLMQQGAYADAMGLYETAADLVRAQDPDAAADIVANGYVLWAQEVISKDDFLSALVLLDFAQAGAATDAMKESVDTARSDLFLVFSESSAEQAQRVLRDAARTVCEHHTEPRWPIFGLNGDQKLAGISGVDASLPENVGATTPGSLHYVVCIEEDTKVVSTTTYPISALMFDPKGGPGVVNVTYVRSQYFWNVTLRNVATSADVATTLIEGSDPPPVPQNFVADIKNPFYFGDRPEIEDLAAWLITVMK